ncbi:MAG TPA: NAD-dependent epimerase/dehydratase family protein [Euzebyales bacterium]|nr:NAD-dependent epimerase/dehydratase family protein [Euzebyales bacterium]
MSSVLVTGGAGFIGSHLVDRLVLDGHHVTVLDDLSRGRMSNMAEARRAPDRHLRFQRCDLVDDAMAPLVIHARPDVVFHLAAHIDVRRSVEDPVADATRNVLGTIQLLEACRLAGVRKIVYAQSGGAIYGEPPVSQLPVAEDFGGHPVSPYGASKRAVEEYLHAYHALYGLDWTSLALANVYGPRQDPRGEAAVVPIFATRMLAGHVATIYGDGTQTRDFVFVDDVVQAFMLAMDAGSRMRCNIGSGRETSVNDLYRTLVDQTGYDQEPYHAPARPGELQRIALDTTRARDALGWQAWTDLPRGLAITLEWLKRTAGAG